MNACVGLHPHGPCPPGVGCNAAPDPVGLRVAELEAEVAEQAQIIQALEDELAGVAALRAAAAAARPVGRAWDSSDVIATPAVHVHLTAMCTALKALDAS